MWAEPMRYIYIIKQLIARREDSDGIIKVESEKKVEGKGEMVVEMTAGYRDGKTKKEQVNRKYRYSMWPYETTLCGCGPAVSV